jgi:hypothetical protein
MMVHLLDESDSFVWKLTTFVGLTVKSMFVDLMDDHTIFLEYLWKLKIPLKINIFM